MTRNRMFVKKPPGNQEHVTGICMCVKKPSGNQENVARVRMFVKKPSENQHVNIIRIHMYFAFISHICRMYFTFMLHLFRIYFTVIFRLFHIYFELCLHFMVECLQTYFASLRGMLLRALSIPPPLQGSSVQFMSLYDWAHVFIQNLISPAP